MLRDGHGDSLKAIILVMFTVVCTGGFFWLYRFYEIDDLETNIRSQHFAWQSEDVIEKEKGPSGGHWPEYGDIMVDYYRKVNSYPATTGSGVPANFRRWLDKSGVVIEEKADTYYGAEVAVNKRESECGWDPVTSNFKDLDCTKSLGFSSEPPPINLLDPSEVDIVTPSIRDLDFLNQWREFFQGFHMIIIQDGDPGKQLVIPEWVDYELYNRNDIKNALGDDEWIISSKDASIRNFGFLVSKKKYIYTIDDDCLPATDSEGYLVNPLALHIRNLKRPATPYFFNTLYDPYEAGVDFVRGYPYSLRDGVTTVVSHGLWMNAPDYDAPTQLLKVTERITKMHEVSVTVPYGVMYPMCSMNVAFDRLLIGPAFMQGLMGVGQPWARYDDMFAGWASKGTYCWWLAVSPLLFLATYAQCRADFAPPRLSFFPVVADHLGYGVKSGMPYIRHNKASNPFTNLKKEYKGLEWQEEAIRFFMKVKLKSDSNDALLAYTELADHIEENLLSLHAYFGRLANAMRGWVKTWRGTASGIITFTPSRSHKSEAATDNLTSRSKNKAVGPSADA